MLKRFPDLLTCKNITHLDIINKSIKEVKTGSTLKIYKNISEGSDTIKRNWKLMYLDSAMLSADQIKRINFQLENKTQKLDKFKLLKIMSREGLNSFDIHTFIIALKSRLI